MKIWREFRFEAAHFLPLVPEDHKCRRLHGHSYRVRLEVEGLVGKDGMVADFADLKRAWESLHTQLDHRCLNDVIDNPTSENLAIWIANQLGLEGLVAIAVSETETTGCELRL